MLLLRALLACAGLVAALPAPDVPSLQPRAAPTPPKIKGSPGCGKPLATKLDTFLYKNITLDDKVAPNRRYAYWLPPGYNPDTPAPVIFAFHGGYQSAFKQHNLDHFTEPDFNDGKHIIIYPEAWISPLFGPDGRIWQISPVIADLGVDDIKYTLAVLDQVRDDFCINDRRVYSAGMSQGGGFTNMLACDPVASTRFAAFAPVAGSYFYRSHGKNAKPKCYFKKDPLVCNPGRKGIPIMATHGGNDITIPYGGGYLEKHDACFPDLDYWLALWAHRNGLDNADIRVVATNWDNKTVPGRKLLGSDAQRQVYGLNDDPRGLVTMIHSGSRVPHNWPRTFRDDEIGGGEATFNVSSIIFEFFSRFELPSDDTAEDVLDGAHGAASVGEHEDMVVSTTSTLQPAATSTAQTQPTIDAQADAHHEQGAKPEIAQPPPPPTQSWTTGRVWPTLVHVVVEAIGSLFGLP
ncbi:Alpha/Beta hydrolase protein [Microdochium trichocladiopsis]|uniref:feruloyl esterase n=1 Tax=Microdochium trichocladiopsis TaxID=1682393 RepID=A0A9P9BW00_9PEZI|nr:Alpha/Beta hydrolase protein [Microdochium trichocladiopsis]KAH7034561.1 Alpha/Beta hydrolase protein [Microdochium trichocladiopsis]